MLVTFMNILSKIEKEQGMTGTIIGVLILIISTVFTFMIILMSTQWLISIFTWVFENLIGVKIL